MSAAALLDSYHDARIERCRPDQHDRLVDDLRRAAESNDYVGMLRDSRQVATQVRRSSDMQSLAADLSHLARENRVASLLAIESLAEVRHSDADDHLIDFLSYSDHVVRRHAAWRLGRRLPTRRAYRPLLDVLVAGGIDTMHAHRTLRSWSASDTEAIVGVILKRLDVEVAPAARSRLVDLLGMVASPGAREVLLRVAVDIDECSSARVAAIGALGERNGDRVGATLRHLARVEADLGVHAALALEAFETRNIPVVQGRSGDGLRIAQLVLAGGLDGQLSRGGRGETGGVASLLVSLGEALVRRADVDHVITIGRGTVGDALTAPLSSTENPLSYATIAFGDEVRNASTPDEVWEHLPAIERGVRRALRLSGPIDVLHLRMADAGTLAGTEVAREANIPICFSVAPDPHNVVQSLQVRGELNHNSFVRLDDESHIWFRARLVEGVAREADRLALFPRSEPLQFLDDLGVDTDAPERRASVVAEGIDLTLLDRASARCSSTHATGARASDVLDELGARIPAARRGLPLVLSVGRMHPVKGMDRLVSAWASDPTLHESSNLVIIGGDLEDPSTSERSVLDAIERAVPGDDPRRAGLVLLGGRPRADVARLQVMAVRGHHGLWAPGGVYVDGALKEEFGLAVIEALAAGLVVVAPSTGGPSTYVDDGDTGVLVQPDADLARAIGAAFDLVRRPGRMRRARHMVEDRYSIDTMAARLVELYCPIPVSL